MIKLSENDDNAELVVLDQKITVVQNNLDTAQTQNAASFASANANAAQLFNDANTLISAVDGKADANTTALTATNTTVTTVNNRVGTAETDVDTALTGIATAADDAASLFV